MKLAAWFSIVAVWTSTAPWSDSCLLLKRCRLLTWANTTQIRRGPTACKASVQARSLSGHVRGTQSSCCGRQEVPRCARGPPSVEQEVVTVVSLGKKSFLEEAMCRTCVHTEPEEDAEGYVCMPLCRGGAVGGKPGAAPSQSSPRG